MDIISGKSLTMRNIEIIFHGSVSILLSVLKLLTVLNKKIRNNPEQMSSISRIWNFIEGYIMEDI
ncbi:hypothetical protein [Wolbachia endosymbiont of Trichogramma pretiosum]|uniref:hypothetical protein n=1 Tax=Wolbachia endosymbiont of Trichogramma pretiosum TaxID=125593 RepID=UPI0015D00416|nr:hypothetical protein [Wolbachia endosymbiont of Trichogramma pretiosum]OCA06661.1 hypothetical protein wTpre_1001 [Wolbachia endosymbiont of Trichogramma pretiosum]